MKPHSEYRSPFTDRYASQEMSQNFSDDKKYGTWRRLWIALAKAEKRLGLDISDEQIEELIARQSPINYDVARAREEEVRHDVMAHVYAYGVQCPKAKPIIHLGATSAFVGDNTDLIQMRDALQIVQRRLVTVLAALKSFALRYKDLPTLGYTHLQPAQPTTVGKRAALWLQDLVIDYRELRHRLTELRFLGAKGATGTQDSFMKLFDNDSSKVEELDRLVSEEMGFASRFLVTGQTYPRKVDGLVLDLLSQIGQSAHKFSNDIRLLQHLKEIEEPFEARQIGSSAMAYKRNPMRSERIASLARYVIVSALNPAFTAATQWLERTLDDSANKRISIPEAFLAVDAILLLYHNVAAGLVVYPKMIERHLAEELPFMATESILMEAVKRGGDRQALHERIRQHAMEASKRVKEGLPNDLMERIAADPAFNLRTEALGEMLQPERFIGRAADQVKQFIEAEVDPILAECEAEIAAPAPDIRV